MPNSPSAASSDAAQASRTPTIPPPYPPPGAPTRLLRRVVALLLRPVWALLHRAGYVAPRQQQPVPWFMLTVPPASDAPALWQLMAARRYSVDLIAAVTARTISTITRRPWLVTITCPIDPYIDPYIHEDDDRLHAAAEAEAEIIRGLLAPATRLVMRVPQTPDGAWPHRKVASAPIETVSVTARPASHDPRGAEPQPAVVTVTATLVVAGRDLFHPLGYACPETPDAPDLLERSLAEVPTSVSGARHAPLRGARIRRRLTRRRNPACPRV